MRKDYFKNKLTKIKKRIKSLLDICCNNTQRSSVFFRIHSHFGFIILDANNAATYKQFIQNSRHMFRIVLEIVGSFILISS